MRRTIAEVRKLVKQVRKTRTGVVIIIMAGVVLASFGFGNAPSGMWWPVYALFVAGIVFAAFDQYKE